MDFLKEIEEMKNDRNNKENIVVNDIVEYFEKQIFSDNFTNNLKENYIKKAINNGKNTCDLRIDFWEYCAGCSNTYISTSCCKRFELEGVNGDYDSYYNYKGIRLQDIHKRICANISTLLQKRIENLGLRVINTKRRDNDYRFGYYKEEITIKW